MLPWLRFKASSETLLEPAGDAIGMLRTNGGKGAEDHEIESTLKDLDGHFLHLASK